MCKTFRLGGAGPLREMKKCIARKHRLEIAHRMMQGFVNHVKNFALCNLSREVMGGFLKHVINMAFKVGK